MTTDPRAPSRTPDQTLGSQHAPTAPGRAEPNRQVSAPSPGLRLPLHRNPVPTHTRLATRRLPVIAYVLVLLLLPAAVVSTTMATGWWRTTGTSLTRAADGTSALEGQTGAEAPASPADPADVKGSMTIQQVVDAFPAVSSAEILRAFGAPADTAASTQLKSLVEDGDENGLDIPEFRTWLQQRLPG